MKQPKSPYLIINKAEIVFILKYLNFI